MREMAYENCDAPQKRHFIVYFCCTGVYSGKPCWLRFSALLSGFMLPR